MDIPFERLADGLAEDGYAVIDDFLTATEVEAIAGLHDFHKGFHHFKKAGIGNAQQHHINESIRGDYIQWLEYNAASAPVKLYLDRLHDLRLFINRSLFLSLKDVEVHATVYPVGTSYKRHLDQFKKSDHRKLSLVCYLNRGWEPAMGGQLRMYIRDKEVDIIPIAGRLVCFRSDQIEHEVLPATHARYSLTGWMLDHELPKRFESI